MADKKLNIPNTGKRTSTQAKLSNFFTKKVNVNKNTNDAPSSSSSTKENLDSGKVNAIQNCDGINQPQLSFDYLDDHETLQNRGAVQGTVYDIGNFIGKSTDDFTKEQLLVNHWKPPKDYVFPCVVVKKNGKDSYRRPSLDLFSQFEWLVFSESQKQKGLFCVYCALFATSAAGGVSLKNLVIKPVTDYKHLLGKDGYLTTHEQNTYHRTSIVKGKEFLKRINNPSLQLEYQINKQHQKEVLDNREKIKSILKCVLFLGVQNVPFRGHRDNGELSVTSNPEENLANDGNFRALVRFRVEAGDQVLGGHITSAPGNAKYTSKTVQNELISCCADEITKTIIERVIKSKWYSIVFDETKDASHQSQLTFALRYVYNCDIHEDFVEFLNPRKEIISQEDETCGHHEVADSPLTGETVGIIVLSFMEKHGLLKNNCVGVATDGCSTMVSEAKGAVSFILKECKNAVHCVCFNHALNLSISKSAKVIHVKRCLGVIKSVVAFFTASSIRNSALRDILGRQLIGLCETRWIERHESIFLFRKSLHEIICALIRVSEWDETATATMAHSLHLSLVDSSFIVTLICLTNILSVTLPLSRLCQKKTVDISFARNVVNETIDLLQRKREQSAEIFHCLFIEAEDLALTLNTKINIPRVVTKQARRDNYNSEIPKDYYRVAVFNPILDHVLNDINERFSSEKSLITYNLSMFVPGENLEATLTEDIKKKLLEVANEYSFVVQTKEILEGEFLHWCQKWKSQNEHQQVPESAL